MDEEAPYSRHNRYRFTMRLFSLAVLALSLPLLTGCDTDALYACTEEFRTIQVRVVDQIGRPVEGLQAQSVLAENGAPLVALDPSDPQVGTDGFYPVASDANLDVLDIDGEAVIFTATGPGVRAEARFVVADDGCHVTREEGPTEVTAVPQ